MSFSSRFLNDDLRLISRGSQHKIGMLNAVFATVSHADDESLEGRGV